MRQVKRRLLNVLTILSLLLCVAAAAFWVRGYIVCSDWLHYQRTSPRLWTKYELCSDLGLIGVSYSTQTFKSDFLVEDHPEWMQGPDGFSHEREPPADQWRGNASFANRLGFQFYDINFVYDGRPYWSWGLFFSPNGS